MRNRRESGASPLLPRSLQQTLLIVVPVAVVVSTRYSSTQVCCSHRMPVLIITKHQASLLVPLFSQSLAASCSFCGLAVPGSCRLLWSFMLVIQVKVLGILYRSGSSGPWLTRYNNFLACMHTLIRFTFLSLS